MGCTMARRRIFPAALVAGALALVAGVAAPAAMLGSALAGISVVLFSRPESPSAAGACDDEDLKKYGAKMGEWDGIMVGCIMEDPPGGTWEDRCIRKFFSSTGPKDQGGGLREQLRV